MDDKIYDLIYENEEVESLALVSAQGDIIENQLPMTEDSLQLVSQTILKILAGLDSAGRHLRGFILKSENLTLQICSIDNVILLLELADPFSANTVDKNVRSILSGAQAVVPQQAAVPQALATPQAQSPEPRTESQSVATANLEDQIDFNNFRASLVKLLKRVAPGGIADKMVNDVLAAEGIQNTITFLDKHKAIEIGEKVVAKIPNAGRRKIIAKEYQTLAKSFE